VPVRTTQGTLGSALYSPKLLVVVGVGTTIADRSPAGDSVQGAVAGLIPALLVGKLETCNLPITSGLPVGPVPPVRSAFQRINPAKLPSTPTE
jgi:hypothetical protein